MTVNGTAEKAGQLPELPAGKPHAQSAQRARSVPPGSPPFGPRNSPSPSPRRWRSDLTGWLTRGDSLLDAHHPSLRIAWSGHRDAAARWEKTWYVRHARHAWGLIHLAVLTVLGVVGWITETFFRTAVAALAILALIRWS